MPWHRVHILPKHTGRLETGLHKLAFSAPLPHALPQFAVHKPDTEDAFTIVFTIQLIGSLSHDGNRYALYYGNQLFAKE